jgi:HEPN domain-containing protein
MMANRYADWLRQAQADLRHARHALQAGDYEWSCFAAQQAAEKAIKALFQRRGMDAWGHTLTVLLGNLPADVQPPAELIDYARALDKHYILTRYPNGFDSGAPTDFYTRSEAEHAIQHAEAILAFCRDQIGEPRAG